MELDNHLSTLAFELANRKIQKSTIQFFHFKAGTKDIPEGDGSGVLVKHRNEYFIFTNAHVIGDGNLDKIFINLRGDKSLNLNSAYVHTIMPESGKREDDKFDVGIVLLREHQVKAIKEIGYTFIDYGKVLVDYEIDKDNFVTCLGYPASQVKIDFSENSMDQTYMAFSNKPRLNKREGFKKFTSENHILVPYPKNNLVSISSEERKTGPLPYGMSGGGMWLIVETRKRFIYDAKLLGIMMEYDSRRSYIIGTKINAFTQSLDRYFDELKIKDQELRDRELTDNNSTELVS